MKSTLVNHRFGLLPRSSSLLTKTTRISAKRVLSTGLFFALLFSAVPFAAAEDSDSRTATKLRLMNKQKMLMADGNGLAKRNCENGESGSLKGYDPVTYFDGPLKQGSKRFTMEYQGDTYLFSSLENLTKFRKSPDKYLPQFNGYCAMSLALGFTNCPDFENFLIDKDGKLFLFETTAFTDGKILWQEDPSSNNTKATENYKLVK